MKKDIDFDKIAKETLDELTKTVKLMLKKYHQELLED